MINGLRISTIVWAIGGILFSLLYFFSSEKTVSSLGLEIGSFDIPFFLTYLGVAYLSFCVFFIIAARDPLKNILWIQLAMVWSFLDLKICANSDSLINCLQPSPPVISINFNIRIVAASAGVIRKYDPNQYFLICTQ